MKIVCIKTSLLNSTAYHAHALRDNKGLYQSPNGISRKGIYTYVITLSLGLHTIT